LIKLFVKELLKDTNGLIRSRKSKQIQYNVQKNGKNCRKLRFEQHNTH